MSQLSLPSTLPPKTTELIKRLVKQIPYEDRRKAVGDVVQSLLDGKSRTAEEVFGWNRHTVELGLHEFRTNIRCISDISNRGIQKAEKKNPQLLVDIQQIMEPHSESDSHLRTELLHTNMTAKAVREALIAKGGYAQDEIPSERSMFNILNRLGYRRRTVAKSKVQKKAT